MSRTPEGETPVGFGTGLKLQVQAAGLILYRALRHPLTPGTLITDVENQRVIFKPRERGGDHFNLVEFDPKRTEGFLDGWNHRPIGPTVHGSGRPEGGEFIQIGWSFSRSFEGVQYDLQVVNARTTRFVDLTSNGVSELSLHNVNSVELDRNLGQLSFFARGGAYHITEKGLTHFLQSSDKTISARKIFKP